MKTIIDGIYFDNAATTFSCTESIQAFIESQESCFANPSSLHSLGIEAELRLKAAKDPFFRLLGVSPQHGSWPVSSDIIFTSGGSEANNLAIFGAVNAYQRLGNHIITSKAEHPSVLMAVKHLEQKGFFVTYLEHMENGEVDLEQLAQAVTDKTLLVSLMYVNNETGKIQPLEKINAIIRRKNKNVIFFTDCVQAFGKHMVNVLAAGVDICSFSSHKIHGVKGVGGLFVKKGVRLTPMLYGGEQQGQLRPGTENSYGILAFSVAAQVSLENFKENEKKAAMLKGAFLNGLKDIPEVYLNGELEGFSPYIVNVSFLGIGGEIMQNQLSMKKIYVSTGAACSKRKKTEGPLDAYGFPKERIASAIRFSFSSYNTLEEVDYALGVLNESVKSLRKQVRNR